MKIKRILRIVQSVIKIKRAIHGMVVVDAQKPI